MAYVKHVWADLESGGTLVTAQKLNEMEQGIEDAQTGGIHIDDEMSLESEYPVQNKVITAALNEVNDEVGEVKNDLMHLKSSQLGVGKNLFNPDTIASWEIGSPNNFRVTTLHLKPNTRYTISMNDDQPSVLYFDGGASVRGSKTATTDSNGDISCEVDINKIFNYRVQLEEGNNVTEFEPCILSNDKLASKSNISDAYNPSKTYSANDYAIYNNALYRCKLACSGTAPTDVNYWEQTQVSKEISSLKSSLGDTTNGFGVLSTTTAYGSLTTIVSGLFSHKPTLVNVHAFSEYSGVDITDKCQVGDWNRTSFELKCSDVSYAGNAITCSYT